MKLHGDGAFAMTGIAQVMLAAGLWATVGVSTKLVTSAAMFSEEMLSFARLAVGGPALLLLVVFFGRVPLSAILALNLERLASFVLGCTVFQLCLFRAFVLLEVTTTVFITVCLPPLMAMALSLAKGDRDVSSGGLIALGVATIGLALFMVDGLSAGFDGQRLLGLALAILASAAFVLMTSAARHLTRTNSPMLVAGTGLTVSALVLGLIMPFFHSVSLAPVQLASWELAGFILYLGLGPTALAYVLYCSGMVRCRSTNVGLVASMVEPAVAAVLAWAVLDERLSPMEVAGCALVMIAMLTLCESERTGRKEAPTMPLQNGVKT